MDNTIKMKAGFVKWLLVSMIGLFWFNVVQVREVQAQNYIDSVVYKIDSARVENSDLVFSIMLWRNNQNWSEGPGRIQDTVLGNVDFYFQLERVVFDEAVNPVIDRKHVNLDLASSGGTNLLTAEAEYYASRFLVRLTPKSTIQSSMGVISILYRQPVEICRVRLRMADPNQNPGLRWDETATDGQSADGEPLIKAFNGDILSNPNANLHLQDNSKDIYACEGGDAEAWIKGYSNGTQLETVWYLSDDPDCINAANKVRISSEVYGNRPTGQLLKHGVASSPWGEIKYSIRCGYDGLSRVDTLYIHDTPKALHEFYLQYQLVDGDLGVVRNSTPGDSQLFVRDSLHAWFAASDPALRDDYMLDNVGASDRTDTVLKCPTTDAVVSFFFFGPECDEDKDVIGSSMNVTYQYQDALGNGSTKMATVTNWNKVESVTAPNGKCLYMGTVNIDPVVEGHLLWVRSISTANGCENGGSYSLYDTVYIQEVKPNQSIMAVLADTVLSAGATMTLTNKFTYSNVVLEAGNAGGKLSGDKKTYMAPATSCSDPVSCTDTLIYYYEVGLGDANTCQMEVRQVVVISEQFYLSMKVFLEGAFVYGAGGLMSSIPVELFPRAAIGGAYESPYNSQESVVSLPAVTGPAGEKIVDWIWISLREASNVGTAEGLVIVDSVSAFVRQDGQVFGMDGKPYVVFENLPQKRYHIIVRHRNHLGVMSKNEVELQPSASSVTGTVLMDFTDLNNVYTSTQQAMKTGGFIPAGKAALWLGDLNGDGEISVADANNVLLTISNGVYQPGDVNFDNAVNMSDYTAVLSNASLRRQY